MGKIVLFLMVLLCFGYSQGSWQLVAFENIDVKCIAQSPQDTAIILIAYADSICRSSNGGTSWSFLTDFWGLPINHLLFDPFDGDIVYAAVGEGTYSDGIYRSTNGGYDWAVLEWIFIPTCITIPGFPSQLMVVSSNGSGVFKSEDGGATWQTWNDGLTDLHVHSLDFCMPFDSFPIFYAGTEHGLFKKSYNGWLQGTGIPSDLRVSGIAYQKSGDIGFATVTGGSWSDGIYKSVDYGMNWQVVDWWIYPTCITINPWFYEPWDTVSVFAGDSGLGIKHSGDLGTTWQETNAGLGNLFINMFSYHMLDTLRLFCATQGGLYRFIYEPGIIEYTTIAHSFFEIPMSVLRTDQRVPVYCNIKAGNIALDILDPAGRKIRTDVITKSTTSISCIAQPGMYFIVFKNGEYYYTKKIIVID